SAEGNQTGFLTWVRVRYKADLVLLKWIGLDSTKYQFYQTWVELDRLFQLSHVVRWIPATKRDIPANGSGTSLSENSSD
ncbi:hypothetical protein PIB30_094087, partial [Stylosanthes scabra]|nr:hypothetical protein [Stylosanthes scabra]